MTEQFATDTSPVFANMALDGLEAVAQRAARNQKVNVVKYADDFIITGTSPEVLEMKVKPVVVAFLKERGLELSEEKTRITAIDAGFDFLGFNVRKYGGKLLIQPAKAAVKHFLDDIRGLIKANKAAKTEELIRQLNRKIRGWGQLLPSCRGEEDFRLCRPQCVSGTDDMDRSATSAQLGVLYEDP